MGVDEMGSRQSGNKPIGWAVLGVNFFISIFFEYSVKMTFWGG